MTRKLRWLIPGWTALVVFISACGGGSTPAGDGGAGNSPAAGSSEDASRPVTYPLHFRKPFPNIDVYALDGTKLGSRSLIDDQETVVIFLSTSCSVCADLTELWKDLDHQIPDTMNVVAVVSEDLEFAQEWAELEKFPLPLYVDTRNSFSRRHEIVQLPTAVGVAADGTILYVRRGVSEMFTPPRAADLLRRGAEELRKRQREEAGSDG